MVRRYIELGLCEAFTRPWAFLFIHSQDRGLTINIKRFVNILCSPLDSELLEENPYIIISLIPFNTRWHIVGICKH